MIGTGAGAGAIVGNQVLTGYGYPKMRHIIVNKLPHDEFTSNCPYHRNCLEELISELAIGKKVGRPAFEISNNQ